MHRFTWDMHYDPIPSTGGGGRGGGGGGVGAVPHRTYPAFNTPWVAPGVYSVRLAVDGKSLTQPITIKLDPRVKITPEVQQIFTLMSQMENGARNIANAYKEAREAVEKLKSRPQSAAPSAAPSAANDALIKQVEEIAPAEAAAGGTEGAGRGGGAGAAAAEPPPVPNLSTLGAQMVGAAMAMQGSEMPPTALQIQACNRQEAAYAALMAKWSALKTRINGPSAGPAGR